MRTGRRWAYSPENAEAVLTTGDPGDFLDASDTELFVMTMYNEDEEFNRVSSKSHIWCTQDRS